MAKEVVALDCEMVGTGNRGFRSVVARVSVINMNGAVLYDKFVKRRNVEITDFRGIRPTDLETATPLEVARNQVKSLLQDRVLVGHDLREVLSQLSIIHPYRDTRDTAQYKPFKRYVPSANRQFSNGMPSLKILSEVLLGENINQRKHNSLEHAWTAMKIYKLHLIEWEKSLGNDKQLPAIQESNSPPEFFMVFILFAAILCLCLFPELFIFITFLLFISYGCGFKAGESFCESKGEEPLPSPAMLLMQLIDTIKFNSTPPRNDPIVILIPLILIMWAVFLVMNPVLILIIPLMAFFSFLSHVRGFQDGAEYWETKKFGFLGLVVITFF